MTLWAQWFMTIKKRIYTAIKLMFKDFFLRDLQNRSFYGHPEVVDKPLHL
jgi:hypothetical protein